ADLAGSALQATGHGRHLTRKLAAALEAAAGALAEHARRGRFRPVATEVPFGPEGRLPGIAIDLVGGRRVEVRGRIDRLDAVDTADGVFLLVIDYKRSSQDLSPDDVELGLALQLALYLAVATREGAGLIGLQADAAGRIRPGGMLYFPVQPGWTTLREAPDPAAAERELLRAHRTRGLLNAEAARRGLFETVPGHSPIVPLRLAKDGSPVAAQSRLAEPDRLDELLGRALAAAEGLGEAILAGQVALAPYRMKDRAACQRCEYRPVCRFEPALGDAYRDLPAAAGGEEDSGGES
ncbi:MAG: PD-(D/E)XK nuclease family protein, partial [Candidatus Sericytochromatia bacterium]|nr:PD-(D/E)XK nuclease family protein [Candidatus Tanganyikabacteria bacterium]